jgi:hypothetical protein
VAYLEASASGYIASRLAVHSSKIRSRLRKRYADLVVGDVPEIILGWLVSLVTFDAYMKRGIDAADAQFDLVKEQAGAANDELKEAADAELGLLDIPLRESTTTTEGITKGTPLAYSEPSPWDWTDVQAEAIRGR